MSNKKVKVKSVYLDGASNTPLDKTVIKAMKPFLSPRFVGNSMAAHNHGSVANVAVADARASIKQDLGAEENTSIYFTSGATESNNWVIKSITNNFLLGHSNRSGIFCSDQEHASVLNACKQAQQLGMQVIFVKPYVENTMYEHTLDFLSTEGDLENAALICVMAVNNETGVSNRISDITAAAKRLGIPTLVDCTQYVSLGGCYMRICKAFSDATFLTFSGHKIYGPTGTGILVSRDDNLLNPLIIGGGQENGLRGGTSNTAGIVGLAAAIHQMGEYSYMSYYEHLFYHLISKLATKVPQVCLNKWPDHHYNIISLNCSRLLDCDKLLKMNTNLANLLALMYNIDVSAGSACETSHDDQIHFSHVLRSLNLSEAEMLSTIRVSFTKFTTCKDIDKLVDSLADLGNLFLTQQI